MFDLIFLCSKEGLSGLDVILNTRYCFIYKRYCL